MKASSMSVMLVAALLSAPALAESEVQTLVVPGTLTDAGRQFASECSDTAFAQHSDTAALAERCERLLARWWRQAEIRDARRANPRIENVYTVSAREQAHLPYDTVAALRQAPLLHSYGGLSASR